MQPSDGGKQGVGGGSGGRVANAKKSAFATKMFLLKLLKEAIYGGVYGLFKLLQLGHVLNSLQTIYTAISFDPGPVSGDR